MAGLPPGTYVIILPDGTQEIWVKGPPRDSGSSEAMEYGATSSPVDVNTTGNTAGFIPQPTPATTDPSAGGSVAAEVGLGVAEGAGEFLVGFAKDSILNALTLGAYGTYRLWSSVYQGAEEDGVLGAVNAVNPLYAIARGAVDAYFAIDEGDYRKAGKIGVQTAIVAGVAIYGTAKGAAAPAAGAKAGTAGAAARGAQASEFGPNTVGAAQRLWTQTARIKAEQLPRSGGIRFVPPRKWNPSNPARGPSGGFIDKFGNEWVRGSSRTAGEAFEWDVQLSRTGRAQLGWASPDGQHLNISLGGEITH